MPKFNIEVKVMPRASLLDPQGLAVEHALSALEFSEVAKVRVGKAIKFRLERPDSDAAMAAADRMCAQLLANPVTEDYSIVIEGE